MASGARGHIERAARRFSGRKLDDQSLGLVGIKAFLVMLIPVRHHSSDRAAVIACSCPWLDVSK
jgi:hypothetical protein